MRINITGQNFDVSKELEDYTHKKLQKLNSYEEYVTSIQISFHNEKLGNIAEGHIQIPGNTISAKTESESMHGAMDGLIDKLVRQLKTYREKITDHR